MPDSEAIHSWVETLRSRYVSYLTTSFYFRDPALRRSFREALGSEDLLKGPFPEHGQRFPPGIQASDLAREVFPDKADPLLAALIDGNLHAHQEQAIRAAHLEDLNVVVASGTASGKTECFLYPILFSLFEEHLAGTLDLPGVRAMVLYPMNALVNDQRERLGGLVADLEASGSDFGFRFGQYIGQTPKDARDRYRNGAERGRNALPGEMVFREDMRKHPPHILFTNYSMLEYLLIRPQDSPLFDHGRGTHWRFLVLDEAHAYRGAKGIEMAMLLRRLKQRLRDGGRSEPFRCIATSATIATGRSEADQRAVAGFAEALFGEPVPSRGVVFGRYKDAGSGVDREANIRRHHVLVRALEGAFLLHDKERDRVVLNRVSGDAEQGSPAHPLEIALCRECGQHYYVGRTAGGRLVEAVRDRSRNDFGVDYYVPREDGASSLCRHCGSLGRDRVSCGCESAIRVQKCENRPRHPDQLKECARCGYTRGGVGDPVQEIVHGADGPNAVLATAIHELLPPDARKILAFADSRQDAAFFAWYAEDSYATVRDRNLLLRALRMAGNRSPEDGASLSIEDLGHRLQRVRHECGVDSASVTAETALRRAYTSLLAEVLTEDTRLSLSGVGLARWHVQLPPGIAPPPAMLAPPWSLTPSEAGELLEHLLDLFRQNRAVSLPVAPEFPGWKDVSRRPQQAFVRNTSARLGRNQRKWGGAQAAVVQHFLPQLLGDTGVPLGDRKAAAEALMKAVWDALMDHHDRASEEERLLERAGKAEAFRLKTEWLRVRSADVSDLWECGLCARVAPRNIRGVCPRNRCSGTLVPANPERLGRNHYRSLYELSDLPARLTTAEHTAQLSDEEARARQEQFKDGGIHLLSSSTTFEVGVDLGDLEVTFLRNVPPEPFNYSQRVGRAGRREKSGLALTYCRRSPHDLHYFANPDGLIGGAVVPPRLLLRNPRIVNRHMTAVSLSEFFRRSENATRFETVATFIGGDWRSPSAAASLRLFCEGNRPLADTLRRVVPSDLRGQVGLDSDAWVSGIAGPGSRLAEATAEVCDEYRKTEQVRDHAVQMKDYRRAGRAESRLGTIAAEPAVSFLARKAIIPKYGFPVDVVELHTGASKAGDSVDLSRDLGLAIAEYAPGSSVIANKLEWQSCGIRRIEGKEPRARHYTYSDAGQFDSEPYVEGERSETHRRKYLVPEFGFVTPYWDEPEPPERRGQRLFSTRPFFKGFANQEGPEEKHFFGVGVTEAVPGELVVLCEGRQRSGFHLCTICGKHMADPERTHRTAEGRHCGGLFRRFALGHELKTDVVRARFPGPLTDWDRHSVGYALALGAADAVAVPERDLNVTLAPDAIILYDDVPGGAGLVAQLTDATSFRRVLERARARVEGGCGCDRSCYGCLRSYRNQFAHPHLDRRVALDVLENALSRE